MKIIDLEFQKLLDLFSQVTGGANVSRAEFFTSDYKLFPGIGRGAYRARFMAIAKGWKKSFSGGYAKGRVYRIGANIVSQSSSLSISRAE